ncbi:RING-H2 finger protein ATL3 [Linum grandiflorum]
MVMGNECAICLDEIQADDPATLIPICNHGYHLDCAHKWFSKHQFCPICRRKVGGSDSPCSRKKYLLHRFFIFVGRPRLLANIS